MKEGEVGDTRVEEGDLQFALYSCYALCMPHQVRIFCAKYHALLQNRLVGFGLSPVNLSAVRNAEQILHRLCRVVTLKSQLDHLNPGRHKSNLEAAD